jgi:hypothetical protein
VNLAADVGPDDADADAVLELAARMDYLASRADVQAARAEVLAARAGLAAEAVRLEASARAAVDIPARVRRAPAKTAGVAAGAAFLLLGGPGRAIRGVRRAILGPRADLPRSMLPEEIERELRKLGDDGKRVRAVLERDFANYLEDRADVRRERDLPGTLAWLGGNLLKPASLQAGRRLAEQLFDPDREGFEQGLRKARERAQRALDEAERRREGPESPRFAEAVRRARERAERQAREERSGQA